MHKSKFTESQIVATLKQVEGGRQVKDVCSELAISDATCRWVCVATHQTEGVGRLRTSCFLTRFMDGWPPSIAPMGAPHSIIDGRVGP